jgi:hypothetical protein
MRIKLIFVGVIYFCCSYSAYAQFPAGSFGMRAGITSSHITNLDKTILSEPYFVNYTLETQNSNGIYIQAFYNKSVFNAPGTPAQNESESSWERRWLIQAQIAFAKQGSELLFDNYEKDFNYKMVFDYSYILVGGDIKYYPFGRRTDVNESKWRNRFKGLNGGLGLQIGFNISPDKINYESWGTGVEPVFDPDSLEQKKLRDVLKGKTIAGVNAVAGYDIITTRKGNYVNTGISIEARVFLGFKDAVETMANQYNFIQNRNVNVVYQLLIGIDLFKLIKKKQREE